LIKSSLTNTASNCHSKIKAYLEHKVEHNPRKATVSMVVQTWEKVVVMLHAINEIENVGYELKDRN